MTNNLFDIKEHPHRRLNILTGEWVLVSPHRSKRPWQGKVEEVNTKVRPDYDEHCYLCPGNKRADGTINTKYNEPFVFINDFSALLKDTPAGNKYEEGLLVASSQKGICKVISFSPRHNVTLAQMSDEEIEKVIAVWQREFKELAAVDFIKYIQIFENKGEIMGCSNAHPHGQIWATSDLPNEIIKEVKQQEDYYLSHGRSLLGDYVTKELKEQERVVLENKDFVVLVPFWAVWPYETMVVSRRHVKDLCAFTTGEVKSLAAILKSLLIKYDNLFQTSFSYSGGIHQRPVNDGEYNGWHWHMHFYPPLLRNESIKKFMVGYEMLAGPQRDITPEYAAMQLRNQPGVHYNQANTI